MSTPVKVEEVKCLINLLVIGRDGNGKSSIVRSIENATKRRNIPLKVVECESVGDLSEDLQVPIEVVLQRLEKSIELSESDLHAVQAKTPTDSATYTKDNTVDAIDVTKDTKERLIGSNDSTSHTNVVDKYNTLINEIEKQYPSCGVVAFLFVLKFGVRFTKQEKDAVEAIKLMLGEEVFEKWVIIIFTYGDLFTLYNDENERHFLDWCKEQTGDINKLFLEVNYRIVLFDNKTKDHEFQEEQLGNLLKQINELVSYDSFVPYRMLNFNKADFSRQMLIPKDRRVDPDICKKNPPMESIFTWCLARFKKASSYYKEISIATVCLFLFKLIQTNDSWKTKTYFRDVVSYKCIYNLFWSYLYPQLSNYEAWPISVSP